MSYNASNHPLLVLVGEILGDVIPAPRNCVIINVNDGSVTDLNGSYIVDLDTISDSDKEEWAGWMSNGDDEVARNIAYDYGTPVASLIK